MANRQRVNIKVLTTTPYISYGWSVPIWKIYGFPKVSLYLERFVLKHATAHIQQRWQKYYQK